jgi:integrase/recombinase XerD
MSFPSELHLFRMWTAKECRIKSKRLDFFRHTFAVHTLEKQLSDGYDPMVIVPRLAAYLGHKSYRETCWYIHLTVASFPELSQKLDRAFVGIIPVGGETDEEN